MIATLFVGLFLHSVAFLKQDVSSVHTSIANDTQSHNACVQHSVANSKHYNDIFESSINILFIYFLAMYRCTSFKGNVALNLFKILTACFISPLFIGFGYYIDGLAMCVIILARVCYLSYFCFKFKRLEFLFYNVPTLMFVQGRAAPYLRSSQVNHYITLQGGVNYMIVNDLTLHFVNPMLVNLAIRGLVQLDLSVVRSIELLNGDFIYIFSPEPVVGVYNAAFDHEILSEIDLKDEKPVYVNVV